MYIYREVTYIALGSPRLSMAIFVRWLFAQGVRANWLVAFVSNRAFWVRISAWIHTLGRVTRIGREGWNTCLWMIIILWKNVANESHGNACVSFPTECTRLIAVSLMLFLGSKIIKITLLICKWDINIAIDILLTKLYGVWYKENNLDGITKKCQHLTHWRSDCCTTSWSLIV